MSPEQAKAALERSARELDRSVAELSKEADRAAKAAPKIVRNVTLPPGTEVKVPHNLGRGPSCVCASCPRDVVPTAKLAATGRVILVPPAAAAARYNEGELVVLQADGWGATIVVDVVVYP